MSTHVSISLPVKNVDRSQQFFAALGFRFNPQFSSDEALCMVVADNVFVLLMAERFFQSFTTKRIVDATQSAEVQVGLSCESRAEVDEKVAQAVAAGGRATDDRQDHGFMYSHGFDDLDGHTWGLMYMDPAAVPPQP